MRLLLSLFIVFTIAVRPIMPVYNYVVNYDYIVENLCENRDKPELSCNGKCFLAKELSNTEKQPTQTFAKVISLDIFVPNDIFHLIVEQNTFILYNPFKNILICIIQDTFSPFFIRPSSVKLLHYLYFDFFQNTIQQNLTNLT